MFIADFECLSKHDRYGKLYNGLRAIVYSYFMATRGTVKLLSRGSGEDLGNCCQRPKAEGNSFPDLLHYRGTMV